MYGTALAISITCSSRARRFVYARTLFYVRFDVVLCTPVAIKALIIIAMLGAPVVPVIVPVERDPVVVAVDLWKSDDTAHNGAPAARAEKNGDSRPDQRPSSGRPANPFRTGLRPVASRR